MGVGEGPMGKKDFQRNQMENIKGSMQAHAH